MELDKWKVFSRPLAAYLSKLKGREDLYEFFRVKSLSPDTLHEVRAGLFEYCEYAAKIFARCGDPRRVRCPFGKPARRAEKKPFNKAGDTRYSEKLRRARGN